MLRTFLRYCAQRAASSSGPPSEVEDSAFGEREFLDGLAHGTTHLRDVVTRGRALLRVSKQRVDVLARNKLVFEQRRERAAHRVRREERSRRVSGGNTCTREILTKTVGGIGTEVVC